MEMVQGGEGHTPAGWCSTHLANEVPSAPRSRMCVCVNVCVCAPGLARWLMGLGSQPQENLKVQKIDRLSKN